MSGSPKQGTWLPKIIGAIVISLILSVFLSLYFFKYVPSQQQLLNGRAFRELEQIGSGIQNKNDAYSTAIHWYLQKRSDGNPLLNSFSFTTPIPRGLKDSLFHDGPMKLEKDAQSGDWQLSYPLWYKTGDTAGHSKYSLLARMNISLSTVLQPVIATYKDIFNDYLVLRDQRMDTSQHQMTLDSLRNEEIVFSSGFLPTGYQVNLDSLIKKDAGFNFITIHDITIEGTAEKLFLYPLRIGNEKIILAGVIDLATYKKGYNTIPFSKAIMIGGLVLLLFIHLPVLKIFVLGKSERIRGSNIRTIITTYCTAALLAFFLFSRIFLDHVQAMDNYSHLVNLSAQVKNSFTSEIDSACKQLRKWDSTRTIWTYPLPSGDTSIGKLQIALPKVSKPPTHMDSVGLTDSIQRLVDSETASLAHPAFYPYANYVYWIDSSGKWIATWNSKRNFNTISLLDASTRAYFQDFVHNNFLTLPNTIQPDSFTIQPLLSRQDGEYTINIVTRSHPVKGRNSWLTGLSSKMYSVCSPLLPCGYNFSIIDGQGNILYDSRPGRALLSNLSKETETPADILEPFRYHTDRYFSSFILQGRPKSLLVTPMQGFPYALLVYYDLSGSDDFQAHLIGMSAFFGAIVLILLILSAIVKERAEERPDILLTPTHHFEWLQPTHIKEYYYRYLNKAMLCFFGLFLAIWGVFEMLPLAFEFSLFYISLLFPFYIALHYYLLREKQKASQKGSTPGIIALPNRPLLIYLGVVITGINSYACWDNGSPSDPLVYAQLAIIGGIIWSLTSFHPSTPVKPGRWHQYYVLAIASGIVLISVVPACSIFWIIFRQESLLQSDTYRIATASAIDQRRTKVNQQTAGYKVNLEDTSNTMQHLRDLLAVHQRKFQHGVYLLPNDTVTTNQPESGYISRSISPEYTRIHRWLFASDSTALAWAATPDFASDSSWVFLQGNKGKWRGSKLTYYNQRDAIENSAVALETDSVASFSSSRLMENRFLSATAFYKAVYIGGILLIGILLLAITWSLARRIYLIDLFRTAFPRTSDTTRLDQLLHHHRDADNPTSITELYRKETQWWMDPIANEQKIADNVDKLHPFYFAVWKSLSDMDRFTLYDFAVDGFTNYKNVIVLTSLIRRHILVTEGECLKFMTPGFREWILRTFDDSDFSAIVDQARREGTWENIKTPLLLLLTIPGVFIFVTQDDIYQKITGFLTALGPLLPLISSIFPKKDKKI